VPPARLNKFFQLFSRREKGRWSVGRRRPVPINVDFKPEGERSGLTFDPARVFTFRLHQTGQQTGQQTITALDQLMSDLDGSAILLVL
jgi:hypothetical protein